MYPHKSKFYNKEYKTGAKIRLFGANIIFVLILKDMRKWNRFANLFWKYVHFFATLTFYPFNDIHKIQLRSRKAFQIFIVRNQTRPYFRFHRQSYTFLGGRGRWKGGRKKWKKSSKNFQVNSTRFLHSQNPTFYICNKVVTQIAPRRQDARE